MTMEEVQDRLGYKDIQTTMNIYAHVSKTARKKGVQNLTEYMDYKGIVSKVVYRPLLNMIKQKKFIPTLFGI